MKTGATETLGELLTFVLGKAPHAGVMNWPPDGFACAALLLEKSGAYLHVVGGAWPPSKFLKAESWNAHVRMVGEEWRKSAAGLKRPPTAVAKAWDIVLRASSRPVEFIRTNAGRAVRNALVEIFCVADQACEGVGIVGDHTDPFERKCLEHLVAQIRPGASSTLCYRISSSKLTVLPKMHTPQSGITIRSLSHHLGFALASEVNPIWIPLLHPNLSENRHGINVLVVPWPLDVLPSSFSRADGGLRNMDDERYGFFRYEPGVTESLDVKRLEAVIKEAIRQVGVVDVIIFPELALSSKDQPKIARLLSRLNPKPILIAGMAIPGANATESTRNISLTIVPLEDELVLGWEQDKHHRWLLDGHQVKQYGLGGVLDPTISWWEYTELRHRELAFFSLLPWLTFSTLICEDLARPDPVAKLLRAVGPNLVFALLMDGPQMASRWPARYATVLADDPGSSVLTISPLGMVKLSKPPGRKESRVVALWKDATSGMPTEIELPPGHEAVVLSLAREMRKEVSADGRDDDGATSYLTLCGVHPIK